MAAHELTDDQCVDALTIFSQHDTMTEAANAAGLNYSTFKHRVYEAQRRGLAPDQKPQFEYAPLPDPDMSAEELLELRKKRFQRKEIAEVARKIVDCKVNLDGPYAIAHFGDPHIDDDGCDIVSLERDILTVRDTPGMFGANVGDLQNNWIGRLARLYADQATTHTEAWLLVEWMLKQIPWLYVVAGNHDTWSGAGDPVKWIMAHAPGKYEAYGVRVNLKSPNGRAVRINCRHDFHGHSMWNAAHGVGKAVQMGWRDHVLTCGHKHISGYMLLKCPSSGLISHGIRCAGYKVYDRYAKELGLPNQNIFSTAVTVIDPQYDDDDTRLVTTLFNVQEAAEYLTWKRGRK